MQKLFVFFLWVCLAKSALHSEKNQTTESFCDNWFLLLDPTSLPTLEYICLKKTSEENSSFEFEDRNLTYSSSPYAPTKDPKLIKNKPITEEEEGFTKFALYLIIGAGICVIYSVLSPSGVSKKTPSKTKIELARRKRWLEKVFERGWIDRPTYHFLLKKIETLPEWLGGIKPLKQTEEDYSSDTSVDLSKRKSGESVVKTKDTSLDNTSR
jgi:hypothetical protein